MSVRFIRIGYAYTTECGERIFGADVEISGQGHYFETGADDVIEATEAICMRLRRDFKTEFDN